MKHLKRIKNAYRYLKIAMLAFDLWEKIWADRKITVDEYEGFFRDMKNAMGVDGTFVIISRDGSEQEL